MQSAKISWACETPVSSTWIALLDLVAAPVRSQGIAAVFSSFGITAVPRSYSAICNFGAVKSQQVSFNAATGTFGAAPVFLALRCGFRDRLPRRPLTCVFWFVYFSVCLLACVNAGVDMVWMPSSISPLCLIAVQSLRWFADLGGLFRRLLVLPGNPELTSPRALGPSPTGCLLVTLWVLVPGVSFPSVFRLLAFVISVLAFVRLGVRLCGCFVAGVQTRFASAPPRLRGSASCFGFFFVVARRPQRLDARLRFTADCFRSRFGTWIVVPAM